MTNWLLPIAAVALFLPDAMVSVFGGTRAAWFYVSSGIESAALWAYVASSTSLLWVQAIALWGFFEAMQRPVCRLAFPMDRPVSLQSGQNLCDAATGLPMSWISVFAALFLAAVVQELRRG